MNQFIAGKLWNAHFSINKISLMASSMFSKGQSASNDDMSKMMSSHSNECMTSILSVIETDIIPRLLGSQSINPSVYSDALIERSLPSENEIDEFVSLCISEDHLEPQNFVNRMLSQGLSKEHIFLDLITPAARLMGVQWENDQLDFYSLTHGLARLHTLTHDIGYTYQSGPLVSGDVKRIMIASAPGSEHLLGPAIVSEFFRKDGWQVVMEISPTVKELVQAVSNEWFDAVGLSISIQAQMNDLATLIAQIKKLSRNRRVVILLGGPIFTLKQYKASDFGAGAICTDAKDAVSLALSLIEQD
jgi:methanogenic corrinoid protein MtbC1